MNRPEFLRVAVAPEVDRVIVDSLPEEPSGAHDLPSQQEFYEQAIPLIRETFSVYFDELKSLVPGRDDHKFAVFADLVGIDLIEVTGHLVFGFGVPDYVVLVKMVITPDLGIYRGSPLAP